MTKDSQPRQMRTWERPQDRPTGAQKEGYNMMLPRTVTHEDARLVKAVEAATEQLSALTEELASLRWHWTLNEDNPERVSSDDLAQQLTQAQFALDEERKAAAIPRVAAVITRLVARHAIKGKHDTQGGGCTRKCVNRATASRDRTHLDAAIDHCLTRCWITVVDGRYLPGDSRPSGRAS